MGMGAWQGLSRESQARDGGLESPLWLQPIEQIAGFEAGCREPGRRLLQVFRQEGLGLGLGQGQGPLRGNELSEIFRT